MTECSRPEPLAQAGPSSRVSGSGPIRAERIVREYGYAGYTVLEFGEGVESNVPIAQRVAQGIIQLR